MYLRGCERVGGNILGGRLEGFVEKGLKKFCLKEMEWFSEQFIFNEDLIVIWII